MMVTRFCSFEEYFKFMRGETLVNTTQHRAKNKSWSIGFCFSEDDPDTAFEYLRGIVDLDVCLVLEIDERHLTESVGAYRRPGTPGNTQMMLKKEWCTTWYNSRIARIISADPHYRQLAPSHRDIAFLLDKTDIHGTRND